MSAGDPAQRWLLRTRALKQLERTAPGHWIAKGTDPQFVLHRGWGRRLPAGTYRLQIRLHPLRGYLDGPALYPGYGGRCSEGTRIDLPAPDANGDIVTTMHLSAPVRWLRLDPSRAPCEFAFGEVELIRIGTAAVAGWRLALQQFRTHARERGLRDAMRHSLAVLRKEGLGQRLRIGSTLSDPIAAAEAGYADWIAAFDQAQTRSDEFARRLAAMPQRPLISVLLPVFDPPLALLRACIDSVCRQHYPDWELCIADDASTNPEVMHVLTRYAAAEPRIRVVRRERNGHIAHASNSALELARGEFVAMLDHDDELAPQALLRVAEEIAGRPDLGIVYSDEDKLDGTGRRCAPYFKPDWNLELLRGQNYFNHLTAIRTALLREVGAFRPGFEGAQDYDAVLRCVERLQPAQIAHVAEVLYHWRAAAGSTALAGSEKNYAADAGLRALREHLQRSGSDATAEPSSAGHYRVRHQLPDPAPQVCLIVPTRDRVELLSRCVDSLLRLTRYPSFEVLIVDNGSREAATHAYLRRIVEHPQVRVLACEMPFNFSALNNFGMAQTEAELVGLLNNDLEVIHEDWLEEMVAQALQPGVGAVGAMLYYPDDRIQHAGVVVGLGGVAGHAYKGCARHYPGQMNRARLAQAMTAVTAACLVVRRDACVKVGGLDETLAVAFNDVDFCLRLVEAGYRNVWTPFAQLYHWESATRGHEDSPKKQARFNAEVALMQRRWGEKLLRDPAYNRNLSLTGDAFTLAWPPREAAR